MKKFFRFTLLLAFSLVITDELWGNLIFPDKFLGILKVAFILAVFEIILKPIIKVLLLPINLLTLGLFRIVIDTLGLYMAVVLVDKFRVLSIFKENFNLVGFDIPTLKFSGFTAFLVTSLTIALIYHIFNIILYNKK
ncbi:MAG: phage holin family protein [Patescibacteria group bacterium]|jgi:uncharacterized membrane protein YvlD (DUF360 family)